VSYFEEESEVMEFSFHEAEDTCKLEEEEEEEEEEVDITGFKSPRGSSISRQTFANTP
jgi:hypothetical protein